MAEGVRRVVRALLEVRSWRFHAEQSAKVRVGGALDGAHSQSVVGRLASRRFRGVCCAGAVGGCGVGW